MSKASEVKTLSYTEGLNELEKLLKNNKLVVFAGSGISVPSGLPSWDDLVKLFVNICEKIALEEKDNNFALLIEEAKEEIRKKQTGELVKIITILKNGINEKRKEAPQTVDAIFEEEFREKFSNRKSNEYHQSILKTNYSFILTTNYDNLFEEAIRSRENWAKNKANIVSKFKEKSYTFIDADKIAQSLYAETPAIIHLHGKFKNVDFDNLILTKEDYYEITHNYPAYRAIMQAIFINYSALFVGYGASDPHLDELMLEMTQWFGKANEAIIPNSYIILRKEKITELRKNWHGIIRTKIIEVENHDETKKLIIELADKVPRR